MQKFSFRSSVFIFFCLVIAGLTSGQTDSIVRFNIAQKRFSDSSVELIIRAAIGHRGKLYGLKTAVDTNFFSSLSFELPKTVRSQGSREESGPILEEIDTTLGGLVRFTKDSLEWRQRFIVHDTGQTTVKGEIDYSYFSSGSYLTNDYKFKTFIAPPVPDPLPGIGSHSLLWIFLTAFAGGLLALLTPCIYSMIPVTVSFFTKRSIDRKTGVRNAMFYAVSIILIFTLLGFLITLIFGPAALNNLATNWIANIIFFLLFVIFGISFLGAFEITLPSSWTNKTDSKANTSGFAGIFFMALTLVIVSFSCTGPIIGNLLVLASRGNYFGPLVGMAGFSTALALPFALFAFFPGKLNILGKAGGWLNAVKVSLGFLELALALKFLSNADLSKGWRILDREVFISLWIVIFMLLGVYLLGKLKFHHDDDLPKNDFGVPYLSVTRLLLAIVSLSFAIYMIPGLWGAPLKGISAFVPPMGTQDFNASGGKNIAENTSLATTGTMSASHPVKYTEKMKIYEPEVVTKYGMEVYYDYQEALATARLQHKPLMLDFTGINCVNCRKMEGQVWSDPKVMNMLKNDFVIVSLYVDVQNIDLPIAEQYDSKELNRHVETLGDKNADFQVTRFGANTQPYYFFFDANEHKLTPEGYGYDPDVQKFINHLEGVLTKFKADHS